MDKFEEDLREILAQSKHKSSGAERFVQASLAENKYPKDFLIYFINSECFGDYESELPAYEAWQHQQAKVEELQKQLSEYIFVAETIDEMYVKEVQKSDELQKRVDAIKQLIHDYHQHSYREADDFVFYLEQALKGEG
ncbi:hypothetical protein QWI50_00975 [Acinetobacter baumannii]|uniref:hypothetical protein n=1 Tax=Acinetobacter baumannii TaxID=470 RepID=UPI002740F22B|nr:hypothetical protein [Acinetobacter baumannii]MDP7807960.1 hypothetical protein [Acinetobacter baumannii]